MKRVTKKLVFTFLCLMFFGFSSSGLDEKITGSRIGNFLPGKHESPIHFGNSNEASNQLGDTFQNRPSQNSVVTFNPPVKTLKKKFGFYSWGTGIGNSGFCFLDVDNDLKKELIFTSGKDFQPNYRINIAHIENGNYRITDQVNFKVAHSISKILPLKLNHKPYLLVAFDNKVALYNLLEKYVEREVELGNYFGRVLDMEFITGGDFNQDLLIVSLFSSQVIDAHSFKMKSRYAFSGTNAAVGNFTGSLNPQVVLQSGEVYELRSHQAKLIGQTASFGCCIETIDIDMDGVDELAAIRGGTVGVYDIAADKEIWKKNYSGSLYLSDFNGDGSKEILLISGKVYAFKATSGNLLWQIGDYYSNFSKIIIEDLDADGQLEIGCSSGYSSEDPDYFFVYDIVSKVEEFKNNHLDSPFHAYGWGDINVDGVDDFAISSFKSESGQEEGILHAFDGKDHSLFWKKRVPESNLGVNDLIIVKTEWDERKSIYVGTGDFYDFSGGTSSIRVFMADGSILGDVFFEGGSSVHKIIRADIDNDGFPDTIAASGRTHMGYGNHLFFLGRYMDFIGLSPDIGNDLSDVKNIDAMDMDRDGNTDIVFSVSKTLYVYYFKNESFQILNLKDVLWAAVAEDRLYVLDQWGYLYLMTPDFQFIKQLNICTKQPGPMLYTDNRLLFTCSDHVGAVELTTHTILWKEEMEMPEVWKVKSSISGGIEHLMIGGSAVVIFENTNYNK